jgi:O-antigen/teichoic acid export membrane protein
LNGFLSKLDFGRLRSWGMRGGMAILDQGSYSGSNFILNILLARWLTQQDYGTFSVAFTVVLVLSGFHNAIQLEPMSVIGPADYPGELDEYLYAQIRLNFIITIPIALLFALTGKILLWGGLVDPYSSQVLVAAGLALPFIFFLWVVRRTFYVRQQPTGALFSSAVYAILLMGGLFVAHRLGMDSSMTGFGLMGAASLLSGLLTLLWWRRGFSKGTAFIRLDKVMSSHWHFGKWALTAAALSVAASQVQILMTASMIDLEAAGAFKAMQNFIMPMAQTITAISILGLPALSADFGRKEYASLRQKGLFISTALTGMAILYFFIIWGLAGSLDHWLYGDKYSDYVWMVAPLGLVPILTAMGTGFSLILRSIQKVQFYLIGGIASGIVGIVSSILMIQAWGIAGSVLSLVLTYFVGLITILTLYKVWYPNVQLEKKTHT